MFKSNSISSLLNSVLGTSPQNSTSAILQRLGVKPEDEELRNFVIKLEKSRKICFQAEDDLVQKQWVTWMSRLASPKLLPSTRLHIIKAALIASSRGHPVKNLTIEAVRLCDSDELYSQRLGVLYLTRMESPDSENLLLVINMTVQKLGSANVATRCISFNLLSLLSSLSSISKSFSSIVRGLEHYQPCIRRKSALSIITLVRTRRDEDFIVFFAPKLIQLLGDRHFSVSLASVQALSAMVKSSPVFAENTKLRDTVAVACAGMLKSCISSHAPSHYDLESVKAPFVQVQILRILSSLAEPHWNVPDNVLPVLKEVLEQKHSGNNFIIYMALLEGTRAVCSLASGSDLIHDALRVLMSFLQSPISDVRVIGLRAASNVFSAIGPVFTASQLVTVLKCLKCSHKSIRKNTIQLVFSMANKQNYKAVCSTLEDVIADSIDNSLIEDTENHIANVIIRYCDDLEWILESQLPRKKYLRDDVLQFLTQETANISDPEKKSKWLSSCQTAIASMFSSPGSTMTSSNRYNHLVTCASLLSILGDLVTDDNLTTFTSLYMDHDDFTTFHPAIVRFYTYFGMRPEFRQTSAFVLGYLKSRVAFEHKHVIEKAERQINNFELFNKISRAKVEKESMDLSFSFLEGLPKEGEFLAVSEPVWISLTPPNEEESAKSLASSGTKTIESLPDADGFEVSWSAEGRTVKYNKDESSSRPSEDSPICSSIEIADEADEKLIREIEKDQKLAEALFKGFTLSDT